MSHTPRFNRSAIALGVLATALVLGGCSTHGSFTTTDGSGSNGGTGTGNTTTTGGTPVVDEVVDGTPTIFRRTRAQQATADAGDGLGGVLNAVGNVVKDTGNSVGNSALPILSNATQDNLANAVNNTGNAVKSLGNNIDRNLGEWGRVADPVGGTLSGLEGTVQSVGAAVTDLGGAVQGLDDKGLRVLAPVTNAAGGLVNRVGAAVDAVGTGWGDTVDGTGIRRITSGTSEAVAPVLNGLVGTVQNTTAAAGLAQPIVNTASGIGGAVQALGNNITNNATTPLGADTGKAVSATGTILPSVASLIASPGMTTPTPVPGTGLSSGSLGGTVNALTTGVGSTLGATTTGLTNGVNTILGNTGVTLPAAPATPAAPALPSTPVSGGLASNTVGAVATTVGNVTTPVQNALGGVLGGLRR